MDDPVPVTQSIEPLYPDANIQSERKRWHHLLTDFESKYGKKPAFVARSPGRVNLIGEHIDYSLYEVLPMAIAADLLIAVATSPSRNKSEDAEAVIPMHNSNPGKHASECTVPPKGEAAIDSTQHEWTNYFKGM